MTVVSLLFYEGVALMLAAMIAFAFGFLRTQGRAAARQQDIDEARTAQRRVLRRADRRCASGLVGTALACFGLSWLSRTNPVFTEPSGNIAGGVVLIMIATAAIVILALLFRQLIVHEGIGVLDKRDKR